jgi:hypothetical protein
MQETGQRHMSYSLKLEIRGNLGVVLKVLIPHVLIRSRAMVQKTVRHGPLLTITAALILAGLACNSPRLGFSEDLATLQVTASSTVPPTPTGLSVTETPGFIPEPSETPPDEPSIGPTMTPVAGWLESEDPLSRSGPWLAYSAREPGSQRTFLRLVNPDGSGRTQLASGIIPAFGVKMSPAGDRFAYLRSGVNDDTIPTLVIQRVPGGEIEIEIPLISVEVLDQLAGEGERESEILRAVSRADTFVWSPQGHYLAFVGALDEPVARLYRFDTWSDNIRPLSTGSRHAFSPNWSPGGEWIVYLEGVYYGTPADSGLTGMRAVNFDGSSTKALYSVQNDPLFFAGWLDDVRFLITSETETGRYGLYQANLDDRSLEPIYTGPVGNRISVDDLGSAASFVLPVDSPAVDDTTWAGVYLVDLEDGTFNLALLGSWRSVEWWDERGIFLANGDEGTVMMRRTGEVVKWMEEIVDPVAPAPDGEWFISYGESGARVYTGIGTFIHTATDATVGSVIWRPDGEGVFLDLFRAEFPTVGHQLYAFELDEWELGLIDLDYRGLSFWTGS